VKDPPPQAGEPPPGSGEVAPFQGVAAQIEEHSGVLPVPGVILDQTDVNLFGGGPIHSAQTITGLLQGPGRPAALRIALGEGDQFAQTLAAVHRRRCQGGIVPGRRAIATAGPDHCSQFVTGGAVASGAQQGQSATVGGFFDQRRIGGRAAGPGEGFQSLIPPGQVEKDPSDGNQFGGPGSTFFEKPFGAHPPGLVAAGQGQAPAETVAGTVGIGRGPDQPQLQGCRGCPGIAMVDHVDQHRLPAGAVAGGAGPLESLNPYAPGQSLGQIAPGQAGEERI